jgi:hypothetical protein
MHAALVEYFQEYAIMTASYWLYSHKVPTTIQYVLVQLQAPSTYEVKSKPQYAIIYNMQHVKSTLQYCSTVGQQLVVLAPYITTVQHTVPLPTLKECAGVHCQCESSSSVVRDITLLILRTRHVFSAPLC